MDKDKNKIKPHWTTKQDVENWRKLAEVLWKDEEAEGLDTEDLKKQSDNQGSKQGQVREADSSKAE